MENLERNGIKELFKRIDGELGRLDGAFNNAALALPGSIVDFRETAMENLLKTNVISTSLLMQEEIKLFLKYNQGGSIVNTSAVCFLPFLPIRNETQDD